jgi:putative effector of murein hydrolase LrgA (UPF0299 family)
MVLAVCKAIVSTMYHQHNVQTHTMEYFKVLDQNAVKFLAAVIRSQMIILEVCVLNLAKHSVRNKYTLA